MEIRYKYKQGDRIRIKYDLKAGYTITGRWVTEEMVEEFAGEIVTINMPDSDRPFEAYNIEEDDGEFYWTPSMFDEYISIDAVGLAKFLEELYESEI